MGWLESLRTAWEALYARKMRSLLTMLGILIGIAAVMLTVGLGAGAQTRITQEINSLGSNLIIVTPGTSSLTVSGWRFAVFDICDSISSYREPPDACSENQLECIAKTLQ